MAGPGEFFPQQFATGILQLAQAQKQFQARLREQRSQAAARNFMEKQRIELAERAQELADFKAGLGRMPGDNRARSGLGTATDPVSGFRQRSAESAMGVRDQLALERGSAELKRAARLQDQTDGALAQKALGDFNDKGVATIGRQNADLIPGLRAGIAAQSTSDLGREAGEEQPESDIAEIRLPNGDIMIVRVGGNSLEDRKSLAALAKAREDTRKVVSDIAVNKEREEATRLLAQKRGLDAQRIKKALGRDEKLVRFRAALGIASTAEAIKASLIKAKQAEWEAAAQSAIIARPGDREAKNKLAEELRAELSLQQETPALDLVSTRNPRLAQFLTGFESYIAGSGGSGGDDAAPPGGDRDIRRQMIAEKHPAMKLANAEALDLVRLAELDEPWTVLQPNLNFPLTNRKTGTKEVAQFHVARSGLIPLNQPGRVLANMLEAASGPKAQRAALSAAGFELEGTESFRIHPQADFFGFPRQPSKRNEISPKTTAPAPGPADESEQEAEDEQAAANKRFSQLIDRSDAGDPVARAELAKMLSGEQ